MTAEHPLKEKIQDEIVETLKGAPGATEKAAALAKRDILGAIKSGTGTEEAVQQVCHGTLSGLLLIDADLPKSTVALLRALSDPNAGIGSDPTEVMTWGMEGIVRVAPSASPTVMHATGHAIESAFMGAGEIFRRLHADAS